MANKLVLTVPAPDDILRDYSAGALVRIESATTETGTYTELGTVAVVALTYQYEYAHAAGTTASWYKTRYSNAGATVFSDYSDAFQSGASSYATLDDFLLEVGSIPIDTRRLAAISRALVEARERIDTEIGYDAFRHPQSGTEARTYHGDGLPILHVHEGIVSLTSVEVRTQTGGSWTTIATADWWLETQPGHLTPRPGEPYFHVRLSDSAATYSSFPRGENRVRLTGAFGWARPSQRHIGANIDLARQQIAADMSFPGGVVGQAEQGAPVGPSKLPDTVWRLKLAESRRFQCSI